MVQGSLENVTGASVEKNPKPPITFSENSHKQVLLVHMESKQPGWMEGNCPGTPGVPVCPFCPHPPRQCLAGVTPLRGPLWNQKVTYGNSP